jgi:hypothetical protein
MKQKHLINPIPDMNLYLFRKIYDGYGQRADKVVKNFRSDNNTVLRKRFMVPVINPNYDYDKFM